MCQNVSALHDLLQEWVQDLLVVLEIHKLAESDEIASHQKLELLPLLGPLLALPRVSLML